MAGHAEPDLEDLDAARSGRSGLFQMAASAMGAIGTVWIFLIMLLIVADVLGRNFFNSPITGVAEVAGRSVVAIVFLQIASAVASDRMTRADFLIKAIHSAAPLLGKALELLFALVGATIFALIAYASWPDLTSSWRTADFFGVPGIFTIPTWPFRAIVVVGSVAAMIAYLILTVEKARARAHASH